MAMDLPPEGLWETVKQDMRELDYTVFKYTQDLFSDARQLFTDERWVPNVPDNTFLDQLLPKEPTTAPMEPVEATAPQEPELDIMTDSVTGASNFSDDDVVELFQTGTDESLAEEAGFEQAETMSAEDAVASVEAFMPSKGMLKEIANSESKMGTDTNTYRDGYHGGVMQVDEIGYEATKDVKSHPKLAAKHAEIRERYGIDWADTDWKNLRNPLHSAIAARLYLSNIKDEIPNTKAERATYWKDKYNTSEGAGSTKHYLDSNKD